MGIRYLLKTKQKIFLNRTLSLSLNAFSFNDVLMAKGTPEKPAFTLFDLLDWCASQNIEAIDITAYYIPHILKCHPMNTSTH